MVWAMEAEVRGGTVVPKFFGFGLTQHFNNKAL